MKKIFKRIAAMLLVGLVGISSVACAGGIEQPEWLQQALCDHVYDEEEILKEPTCVASGKKEKICSSCGATKTVAIKPTGEHIFNDEMREDGTITNVASWNSRATADGAGVANGSVATLKKVVGNTVVVGKDENGMNGKLVHSTFGGIQSTGKKGEEGILSFPKTELPVGTEIDFESGKIIDNYVTIELKANMNGNTWQVYDYKENGVSVRYGYSIIGLPTKEHYAQGWSTDFNIESSMVETDGNIILGLNGTTLYVIGIRDKFPTRDSFAQWLTSREDEGNPVTIRYIPKDSYISEMPFTAGNQYTVWNGGTETVLENDGAEYGVSSELTIDYVCGCTVCGKASVEIPPEETVECITHTYLATGYCSTCDAFMLDRNINYPETSGMLDYGWYRVSNESLSSVEFQAEIEVLSSDYELNIQSLLTNGGYFNRSWGSIQFMGIPNISFYGATATDGRIPAFLFEGYVYFAYFGDTVFSIGLDDNETLEVSTATAVFKYLNISLGTIEKLEFVN